MTFTWFDPPFRPELLGESERFVTTPGYDGWPLVMLRLTLRPRQRFTPSR